MSDLRTFFPYILENKFGVIVYCLLTLLILYSLLSYPVAAPRKGSGSLRGHTQGQVRPAPARASHRPPSPRAQGRAEGQAGARRDPVGTTTKVRQTGVLVFELRGVIFVERHEVLCAQGQTGARRDPVGTATKVRLIMG